MYWSITLTREAHTDKFGVYHETTEEKFDIPYELGQTVWYCFKKRKKWVILRDKVVSVWATNTYGIRLVNDWCVSANDFCRLFVDRDKAIEYCLTQNRKNSVKIYGEY